MMGNYSELYIDRLNISWKNYIPEFLGMLFEEGDFYSVTDSENDWFSEIGFKASSERIKVRLEQLGFTLEFCATVFQFFYDDLLAHLESALTEQIRNRHDDKISQDDINVTIVEYFAKHPATKPSQQINDFLKLIVVLLKTDFREGPFSNPYVYYYLDNTYTKSPQDYFQFDGTKQSVISFQSIVSYLLSNFEHFQPSSIMLCILFDDDQYFSSTYMEIIYFTLIRLLLSTTPTNGEVIFDLADEQDYADETEIRELHGGFPKVLFQQAVFYSKVFHLLFEEETDTRINYAKAQCKDLLIQCDRKDITNNLKGRFLEDLTETLFTSTSDLEVLQKRVSTPDEEIDLVIKNNASRPFWISLGSPLLFVECKNWNQRVGVAEVRNFGGKLQNHSNLVRIGFFVSLNGFTSAALEELRRMGRSQHHIVLIERKNIEEYIFSDKNFFDWLENIISVFY